MTVTVERSVEEFTATPRQLFIDGQWTQAASGKTFETPNPATGHTLASVAEGDAEDIDRAVRAARKAFDDGPWGRLTPSERGRVIWRIGDLILEHADISVPYMPGANFHAYTRRHRSARSGSPG
jgi:phenylacetaldehyde dehydrogenase